MSEKKEIIIVKVINDDVFKGEIKIAALSYPERIAMSKKSVTTLVEVEGSAEVKINGDLDRSEEYYHMANKQIREVSLIIKNEERKIDNVEELMIYEEGTAIIMDIATSLIAGITLGNGKSKASEPTVLSSTGELPIVDSVI